MDPVFFSVVAGVAKQLHFAYRINVRSASHALISIVAKGKAAPVTGRVASLAKTACLLNELLLEFPFIGDLCRHLRGNSTHIIYPFGCNNLGKARLDINFAPNYRYFAVLSQRDTLPIKRK